MKAITFAFTGEGVGLGMGIELFPLPVSPMDSNEFKCSFPLLSFSGKELSCVEGEMQNIVA